MKKKKSPALMIGAVVILVTIAVVTNLINSGFFDKLKEQRVAQSQPEAPPGQAPDTAKEMRDRMRSVNNKSPEASPEMGKPGTPSHPTVEIQKPKKFKPKPNDTATTGQWY